MDKLPCPTGKFRYASPQKAHKAGQGHNHTQNGVRRRRKLKKAYKCNLCGAYHLTSQTSRPGTAK